MAQEAFPEHEGQVVHGLTKRVLIVHYHEIWLKGGNKKFFLSRLIAAVKRSLAGLASQPLEHVADRLLVAVPDESLLPVMVGRLQRVFGIAYIGIASEVPCGMPEIAACACHIMGQKNPRSFAVRAKIADAACGLHSMGLERELGHEILTFLRSKGSDVRVNLEDPEVTCWVEVIPGKALVYAERAEGAGGLPAATGGRLVMLLSGGFDSGVAAYKMMRRSAHLIFVHFYGSTSASRGSSKPVAERIVRTLTPYQYTSRLYLIPFDSVQRQIVAGARESLRVLLYRRMMARIGREICQVERGLGLVTGDSVSQVASQTLHNLAAVDQGIELPIYRPLAGDDKEEILRLARRIGTYTISCEPFEDCCPRFMPRSPAIFSNPEELGAAEKGLDIEGLVTEGLEGAQVMDFKYESGQIEVCEGTPHRFEKLVQHRKALRAGIPQPPAPVVKP
ncbi:MAG: tRNA 4-thiouridine(8) synthase ThiI [Acidobacteria bacterium]|nr:tRNA 4-thiouridine(8) synthase ThiI [Acidobacteriota bacterium]